MRIGIWLLLISGAVVVVAWMNSLTRPSARGSGNVQMRLELEKPIPDGLSIQYAPILFKMAPHYIERKTAPDRSDWTSINAMVVEAAVSFDFARSPTLFGSRTRRTFASDALLVRYVRGNRSELRVIPISDSVHDPPNARIIVPVIEPRNANTREVAPSP